VDGEVVLGPVGEDRAVAAVGDEFFGELCDLGVEVIHDVVDDAGGLEAASGVVGVGVGLDGVGGPQTVHVDVAVGVELVSQLLGQLLVQTLREVAQRVFEGQHLLVVGEVGEAFGGMGHLRAQGRWLREGIGEGFGELLLEDGPEGGLVGSVCWHEHKCDKVIIDNTSIRIAMQYSAI